MCEDSQGRPANMLLFQIQMGVLTSNFKIIIKITRPPVQSSPVQSSPVQSSPPVQRMYTTKAKLHKLMQMSHNHLIHVVIVQIETPTVSDVYQCTTKLQFEPLHKMAGQCLVVSQKCEQLHVDIQCY